MNRLSQIIFAVVCYLAAAVPALSADANTCGYNQGPGGWYKNSDRSGPYSLDGNCVAALLGGGSGSGGAGSSPASPSYTVPAGLTPTTTVCTLPQYSAGGSAVCTDQTGAQTTTTCAANTPCLISAANSNRKTLAIQNKTAGSTIEVGYAASLAPGKGLATDGPATAGASSPTLNDSPASTSAYYALTTATGGATLVMVSKQ